jgi:hypothetical protein
MQAVTIIIKKYEKLFRREIKSKRRSKKNMRKRKLAMWKLCNRNKVEVSGRKGGGGRGENLPRSFTLSNINLHPTQHTNF